MRCFQGYPGLLKNNEQTRETFLGKCPITLPSFKTVTAHLSLSLVGSRLQVRCSLITASHTLPYTWYPCTQQSFSNVAIMVEVAMDRESSRMVLSIGIDFRAGAHVQLSELTAVLRGSLLKECSEYMCTINRKSNLKIFKLKNFHGGPMKIYMHEHLTHEYFYTQKYPDLRYIV